LERVIRETATIPSNGDFGSGGTLVVDVTDSDNSVHHLAILLEKIGSSHGDSHRDPAIPPDIRFFASGRLNPAAENRAQFT
jgi:hypothetical protein